MPTATPPPYLGRATKAGIFGVLLMPLGAQSDARRHFLAPFVDFWALWGGRWRQFARRASKSRKEPTWEGIGEAKRRPREPQGAPRSAKVLQKAPKVVQKAAKVVQKGTKSGSRNAFLAKRRTLVFVRQYNDFHGFWLPGGCPGTPKSSKKRPPNQGH